MNFRTVLLASTLLCSPAFAADIPGKAAPLPAPNPVASDPFSGWFLGGEVGYDWGKMDPAITGVPTFSPSGLVGGASLSYRSAIAAAWYLGLQTSFDWTSGSETRAINKNINATAHNAWDGATMVQVGWRAMPDLLVYGEVGVGYGEKKASVSSKFFSASDSERGVGFAYGAGAEYNLRSLTTWPLLATVEWRHIDLGSPNFGAQVGGGVTIGTKIKSSDDAVLAGVKWKFGS